MKFYPTDTFSYKSSVYGFFSLYILVAAVCWDMNTASTHSKNTCCAVEHTFCNKEEACKAKKQTIPTKKPKTEKEKNTPCSPCNNAQSITTPIIFWYEHSIAYQLKKKDTCLPATQYNVERFAIHTEKYKLTALPTSPSRTAGKDRLKHIHCWRV